MTKILGISAFYHDSAAALLVDEKIVAAAQEERFTRKKNDSSFPRSAINYILEEAKISFNEIDYVVFYEKPLLKFKRLLKTYIANAPKGYNSFENAMNTWIGKKIFQKKNILKAINEWTNDFNTKKLLFAEHHESHAASAFYPSPFKEAIILTLDGVGESATSTVAIGKNNKIDIIKEIHFPHSIGLLYSAFTFYLGFKVNNGEYKVMGLAPYGKPIYKDLILNNLIDVKEDGSFFLNQLFFNYTGGFNMINQKFIDLFKKPKRNSETENITQFHMDIASSIQYVLEEIILKITKKLSCDYKLPNLCMAGGVALNCVANSKILKSGYFKNLWIQPASGDAGGALGAALLVWYKKLNNSRTLLSSDSMRGSYLGPKYSETEIEKILLESKAKFKIMDNREIIETTAKAISENKTIGWFQGRMEFGPRALGNRSILANPLSDKMQKILNLKIKYRESFRPFAPSIIKENLAQWFEFDKDSPYMLFVAKVQKKICINMTDKEKDLFGIDKLNIKRSIIPAVTHVDYSSRIQTVHEQTNPKYHSLIKEFERITGCPILVNTSFNIQEEPIVCNPKNAFKCFMNNDLDILVIENFFLLKEDQINNI